LIELHLMKTGSVRARSILGAWDREARKLLRLTPKPQA
jgi:hypothetical protein